MIPKMLLSMQSIRTLYKALSYSVTSLFILFACQVIGQDFEPEWQLAQQKQNITIYTRQTSSGYSWVKATIEVYGEPKDFLTLLNNIALSNKWIDNCEKVEFLVPPTEQERIVRTTFNAPWPIKDREMITKSITKVDLKNQNIVIQIDDYSKHYPPNSGFIRIQNVSGLWNIKKSSENNMVITYSGYGEPSGKLPTWLSNKLMLSSIFKTFANLREILGEPKRKTSV